MMTNERLLASALFRVLVAAKVIRSDAQPSVPELLAGAEAFENWENNRRWTVEEYRTWGCGDRPFWMRSHHLIYTASHQTAVELMDELTKANPDRIYRVMEWK